MAGDAPRLRPTDGVKDQLRLSAIACPPARRSSMVADRSARIRYNHQVTETPFTINTPTGPIAGSEFGHGPALLFLHGGPGLSDYADLLAPELGGWRTVHYQQRIPAVSPTYSPRADRHSRGGRDCAWRRIRAGQYAVWCRPRRRIGGRRHRGRHGHRDVAGVGAAAEREEGQRDRGRDRYPDPEPVGAPA